MALPKNHSLFRACLVAAHFLVALGISAPTLVPAPVPTLTPGPSILPTPVPNPVPTPTPTHVPTPYPSIQMCGSQPLVCGHPVLESTTGRGDYAGGPASGEVTHFTAVGWRHHRPHQHLHPLLACGRSTSSLRPSGQARSPSRRAARARRSKRTCGCGAHAPGWTRRRTS